MSEQEYLHLQQENIELKIEIAKLQFQIKEFQRLLFGAKSERFVPVTPDQASLFDLGTVESAPVETEIIERKKAQGPKKQPVRLPIPSHLPRKETVLEPEDVDFNRAIRIGEEVTEFLNYTPSNIYVERIVRPKYKLLDESIAIARLDNAQPIAKSNVGAGLLAYILISKYVDHLPLYRLVQMFKREKVDIAESTINGWVQMSMKLLEPLFDRMQSKVMSSGYLMADETTIPVLESLKPGSTHKGYYWVYYSPPDKLISFQYHKTRQGEAVKEHLHKFEGYLHADGYAGYDQFEKTPNITLLACMTHARRKFHAALENDKERAEQALILFGVLYDIEREAREQNMSYEQRHALRQKKAPEALQNLEDWLKDNQNKVLPKSAIGEAINYTLKLWTRLKRYTEDGKLEIDNNLIENKIRPITLGRKNYLFAGSHEAAKRAGMMYSFMAMCKMEEVNPQEWLTDVLQNINNHSIQQLDELLPQNWKMKQNGG